MYLSEYSIEQFVRITTFVHEQMFTEFLLKILTQVWFQS